MTELSYYQLQILNKLIDRYPIALYFFLIADGQLHIAKIKEIVYSVLLTKDYT